jgi:hypothetical protein
MTLIPREAGAMLPQRRSLGKEKKEGPDTRMSSISYRFLPIISDSGVLNIHVVRRITYVSM